MASFTLLCHEITGCLCVMQAEAAGITGGGRASTAPSLQFGYALEGGSDARPDPHQQQQLTRMLTAGMTVREKVVEVVGRANAKVQMFKSAMHGGACVRITALPVLVISDS